MCSSSLLPPKRSCASATTSASLRRRSFSPLPQSCVFFVPCRVPHSLEQGCFLAQGHAHSGLSQSGNLSGGVRGARASLSAFVFGFFLGAEEVGGSLLRGAQSHLQLSQWVEEIPLEYPQGLDPDTGEIEPEHQDIHLYVVR